VAISSDEALSVLCGLVYALEAAIQAAVERLDDDAPAFLEEVQDRFEEQNGATRALDLQLDGATARDLIRAVVQRARNRAVH